MSKIRSTHGIKISFASSRNLGFVFLLRHPRTSQAQPSRSHKLDSISWCVSQGRCTMGFSEGSSLAFKACQLRFSFTSSSGLTFFNLTQFGLNQMYQNACCKQPACSVGTVQRKCPFLQSQGCFKYTRGTRKSVLSQPRVSDH